MGRATRKTSGRGGGEASEQHPLAKPASLKNRGPLACGMGRGGEGWHAIRLLSLTSLLADISGEMLMAVLPFLLVSQGASGLAVGLVGAASEAVGHLSKWLGGRAGDRVRHKRLLVAAGYLVATLSRFGIALATTWPASLLWRSADRVGKGIRTAPRDAMLHAAVPESEAGRAFAYHRAADTAGAVVGVLAALFLLSRGLTPSRIVLASAFVGLAAVLPLLALREPELPPVPPGQEAPRRPGFRAFIILSSVFAAGQVSYLFFLLRTGASAGILAAVAWYLLFNVVYAAASYPLGVLADAWGKARVLLGGFLLTALASLLFAFEPTPWLLAAGFTLLGVSFAATDGTGRAIAAVLAGSRHSTRLGLYHASIGFAALAGGTIGGALWDRFGPPALFEAGAAVVLLAGLAMAYVLQRRDVKAP
jgi:MFS family permease